MRLAFGDFHLDLDGCELTKAGRPVMLERRPTEVLCLLASRAGELVSRRELSDAVWGASSRIDSDLSLNTAIRKIRMALADPSEAPSLVETAHGRGYRFRAPIVVEPAAETVTLAVLPFDNLTGSADQDYLADGFTEEVIATLGTIAPGQLRIVGRRSVMQFRRSSSSLAEIGKKLGATYLLESGLRQDAATLRVATRLMSASDDRVLWSASFDGAAAQALHLQQDVSSGIVDGVRTYFGLNAAPVSADRHTLSEAAYDLFMRGRYCAGRNQSGMNQEAIGYLIRATEVSPGYALAWSALADAYSASPINGDMHAPTVWRQAREAAEAALRSGPDLAEAHASMGFVRFWLDWDWHDAERLFRHAVMLNPSYAFAHRMVGIASSHIGWHAVAATAMRRAVALDPLFPMHHALSAMVAFAACEFAKAASFARDAIEVDPRFWIGHLQLAQAMEQCGEPAAALAALEVAGRLGGNSSKPAMLRGYILARLGHVAEARAILLELNTIARHRFVPPFAAALIHMGLGEAEPALIALENCVEQRDVNLVFLLHDPKWNPLRGEPRFQAIIDQCGFFRSELSSAAQDHLPP